MKTVDDLACFVTKNGERPGAAYGVHGARGWKIHASESRERCISCRTVWWK